MPTPPTIVPSPGAPAEQLPSEPHHYNSILESALRGAEAIVTDQGKNIAGVTEAVDLLDGLPMWISQRELEQVTESHDVRTAFDAPAMIDRLLDSCRELDALHDKRIDVSWWTRKRLRMGQLLCGTLRAVPTKERALWNPAAGPVPWWRMDLSMARWILLDEEERLRLLHHELMHADCRVNGTGLIVAPGVVEHDVMEFAATVGRFGVDRAAHVAFIENATAHAQYGRAKITWLEDSRGQGLFPFSTWGEPASKPAPKSAAARK